MSTPVLGSPRPPLIFLTIEGVFNRASNSPLPGLCGNGRMPLELTGVLGVDSRTLFARARHRRKSCSITDLDSELYYSGNKQELRE